MPLKTPVLWLQEAAARVPSAEPTMARALRWLVGAVRRELRDWLLANLDALELEWDAAEQFHKALVVDEVKARLVAALQGEVT